MYHCAMTEMNNVIDLAIKKAGGVVKLAEKAQVDQTTVSQWRRRGRVSHGKALTVSRITGISVHRLRPDVFGEPRRSKQPTR
jgi:DNA-binding transcriptional regulator YdaS (Cro superfamily)